MYFLCLINQFFYFDVCNYENMYICKHQKKVLKKKALNCDLLAIPILGLY